MTRNLKKIPLLFCSFVLILLLYSCKNESGIKDSKTQDIYNPITESYSLNSYSVTEKGAAKQAEELLNLFDKNPFRSTRRSISSVIPIGRSCLRSNSDLGGNTDSVPLAYVVNFANNGGYAVLSGDSRLQPVWMFSDTGNLDPSKMPDNPTSLMMMNQIELAYNINHFDVIDTLSSVNGNGKKWPAEDFFIPLLDSTEIVYGPWEIVPEETTERFIPVFWGQSRDPYNSKITEFSPHAGCVTAAVAQLMAYHKYPYSYEYQRNRYRKYNWDGMLKHNNVNNDKLKCSKEDSTDIAYLYRDLGRVLRVKYGPKGSSAYDSSVPKTFRKFGYSSGGRLDDFSFENVKYELTKGGGKGYPLYISATDTMYVKYKHFLWWHWQTISYESGHAFILDGVGKAKRLVTEKNKFNGRVIKQTEEKIELVHANLGWNKQKYNAYYNVYVIDVDNPVVKDMTKTVIGSDGVYRFNFKTITGIRP